MMADECLEVVGNCFELFKQWMAHLGCASIKPQWATVVEAMCYSFMVRGVPFVALLVSQCWILLYIVNPVFCFQGQLECQHPEDSDDEDDDAVDYDHVVVEVVLDLMGIAAQAEDPDVCAGLALPMKQVRDGGLTVGYPHLNLLLIPPPTSQLVVYCAKNMPATDKAAPIGTLGEVTSHAPHIMDPLAAAALPHAVAALRSDNVLLRHNAAWAVGQMVSRCPSHSCSVW